MNATKNQQNHNRTFTHLLALHRLWLEDPTKGERLDLSGLDLRGVDLRRCRLDGANLLLANLTGANLAYTCLNNVENCTQLAEQSRQALADSMNAGDDGFSLQVDIDEGVNHD